MGLAWMISAGSYTAGRPLEDADSRTIFVSNVITYSRLLVD